MLGVSDKSNKSIDNYGNNLCRHFPHNDKIQAFSTAKQFFPLPYRINKYVDFRT
jgi:hypothetical protein